MPDDKPASGTPEPSPAPQPLADHLQRAKIVAEIEVDGIRVVAAASAVTGRPVILIEVDGTRMAVELSKDGKVELSVGGRHLNIEVRPTEALPAEKSES